MKFITSTNNYSKVQQNYPYHSLGSITHSMIRNYKMFVFRAKLYSSTQMHLHLTAKSAGTGD